MSGIDTHTDYARALDRDDALASFASRFCVPEGPAGNMAHYLCGHSLGLMPASARALVSEELERWAKHGVAGHFDGERGWFAIHERFAAPLARLLGADASEIVAMNSLTVNLHLMLVSFFRPEAGRQRILIEAGAFPSDRYAVQSQLALHGLDPDHDLLLLGDDAFSTVNADKLDEALAAADGSVALVLLPGVQYLTGEAVDLTACTKVARRHGARIGFDLAHAIGNLPLDLEFADPDFAVWCSYKYLNGGPGSIGGCYVNRRWLDRQDLPRLAGWWGHDKSARFSGDKPFSPMASAEAWQLSNPPVLAMIPLEASLALFDAASMAALRRKSVALTQYAETLLEMLCGDRIELLTPRDTAARGAQLSARIRNKGINAKSLVAGLAERDGVVVDSRAPDIVRLAPVPLYNSFADVHAAVTALARALGKPSH